MRLALWSRGPYIKQVFQIQFVLSRIETFLAWRKVQREYLDGTLAGEFDNSDKEEINTKLRDAEEAAKDEVWASYRYLILHDNKGDSGLNVIDLGAGHSSQGETLSTRVITTLKSRALLNDSPGAGYIERMSRRLERDKNTVDTECSNSTKRGRSCVSNGITTAKTNPET